jgi:hemoglobin
MSDLQNREDIERFVEAFYSRLLRDEVLATIFLDAAAIDIKEHLPRICDYWEKLLLGGDTYKRHTMNIHRALHAKRPLQAADFQRWLDFFNASMDGLYQGDTAARAKQVAAHIARNMQKATTDQAAL